MYIFGIDVQLNILVLLNLLAVFIEFLLVWQILRKMKRRAMHREIQREMSEEGAE
jgi:hypothetical protein